MNPFDSSSRIDRTTVSRDNSVRDAIVRYDGQHLRSWSAWSARFTRTSLADGLPTCCLKAHVIASTLIWQLQWLPIALLGSFRGRTGINHHSLFISWDSFVVILLGITDGPV